MPPTDAEIAAEIKGFRPEFANELHIRIMNRLGDIGLMERELTKKEKEARGVENLREKIKKARIQVVKEIIFAKQQHKK